MQLMEHWGNMAEFALQNNKSGGNLLLTCERKYIPIFIRRSPLRNTQHRLTSNNPIQDKITSKSFYLPFSQKITGINYRSVRTITQDFGQWSLNRWWLLPKLPLEIKTIFTSSALDFLLGNDNDKGALACQLRWNCEFLLIVHQQKKFARLSGEGQWLSRKNVFSDFRGVFFRDLLSNKTNITLMSGVDFRAESPQTMPHNDKDNFSNY